MEEMNHAALIETINELFLNDNPFVVSALEGRVVELNSMNLYVKEMINLYKTNHPSRVDAFKLGIELENSIGEFHFEMFMTERPK